MNNNLKGFAYGIATSVTFGLIPLFTLPLMEKGMRFDSILFYRFLFAAIALSGMLLAKKESFRTEMRNLPILILLGAFYTGSAIDSSHIVGAHRIVYRLIVRTHQRLFVEDASRVDDIVYSVGL